MKNNKCRGFGRFVLDLLSDICEGAKILDNYVIHKDARVKLCLEDKANPEKPIFDFDRTWNKDKSILQLLVTVLGIVVAIFTFVCMAKLRKAEKRKMKEKIKKVKEQKKQEIKALKEKTAQ